MSPVPHALLASMGSIPPKFKRKLQVNTSALNSRNQTPSGSGQDTPKTDEVPPVFCPRLPLLPSEISSPLSEIGDVPNIMYIPPKESTPIIPDEFVDAPRRSARVQGIVDKGPQGSPALRERLQLARELLRQRVMEWAYRNWRMGQRLPTVEELRTDRSIVRAAKEYDEVYAALMLSIRGVGKVVNSNPSNTRVCRTLPAKEEHTSQKPYKLPSASIQAPAPTLTPAAAAASPIMTDPSQVVPVKRGRGRPRKHPLPGQPLPPPVVKPPPKPQPEDDDCRRSKRLKTHK